MPKIKPVGTVQVKGVSVDVALNLDKKFGVFTRIGKEPWTQHDTPVPNTDAARAWVVEEFKKKIFLNEK